MVMLKMLNKLGYQADVAVTGKEVIRSLELQTYDLILMDVQMPEWMALRPPKPFVSYGLLQTNRR